MKSYDNGGCLVDATATRAPADPPAAELAAPDLSPAGDGSGLADANPVLQRSGISEVAMSRTDRTVTFVDCDDGDRITYAATVDNQRWRVRINDFPEDPSLYSLIVDGKIVEELMDWPKAWRRPDAGKLGSATCTTPGTTMSAEHA